MRRLIAWLTFIPVLVVGLWVFWFSNGMMRADFASMRARFMTEQWLLGKPWTAPEWNTVRDDLAAAIRITPDNPMLYDYMGALFSFRGNMAGRNQEIRRYYYAQARPYQEYSLHLREHNTSAWTAYAFTLFMLGERGPDFEAALRRGMALGQYELNVRPRLRTLILGSWKTQPPDMREWLLADYCEQPVSQQKKMAHLAAAMGNRVLASQVCLPLASK